MESGHSVVGNETPAPRAPGPSSLDLLPLTPLFRAQDAPISHRTLQRLVQAGLVERVSHGIYRRTDAPSADLDLVEVALRLPIATICLTSALAWHDLVTEVPGRVHLAFPRGHHSVQTDVPVSWHAFDAATFEVERQIVAIDGTQVRIGVYSPARAVADAFRVSRVVGRELAVEALKSWLGVRGNHPADLLKVAAHLPRATRPLRDALEILL